MQKNNWLLIGLSSVLAIILFWLLFRGTKTITKEVEVVHYQTDSLYFVDTVLQLVEVPIYKDRIVTAKSDQEKVENSDCDSVIVKTLPYDTTSQAYISTLENLVYENMESKYWEFNPYPNINVSFNTINNDVYDFTVSRLEEEAEKVLPPKEIKTPKLYGVLGYTYPSGVMTGFQYNLGKVRVQGLYIFSEGHRGAVGLVVPLF